MLEPIWKLILMRAIDAIWVLYPTFLVVLPAFGSQNRQAKYSSKLVWDDRTLLSSNGSVYV